MKSKHAMKYIIQKHVVLDPDQLNRVINFARLTWDDQGPGEIFLISGDFGTGKSTLLKVMKMICHSGNTCFADDGGQSFDGRYVLWRYLVAVDFDIHAIQMQRIELNKLVEKGVMK